MLRFVGGMMLAGLAHGEITLPAGVETRFAEEAPGTLSPEWTKTTFGSSAEAKTAIDLIWKAYRKGAEARGEDQKIAPQPVTLEELKAMPEDQRPKFKPSELDADGKTMPYFLVAKGKKPEKGWPLILALHGGGGTNQKLSGPHDWPVNTKEWQAQMALFERIYPGDAMYFIPRMADDNDGRWYYDYCQKIYDQVIRRAILFREVDPDRVYVTGISEGGYTAYRLPANRPDRFAAACAMAAAEPMENAPPENLRNLPFRCGIGENDTMFDRIGLARRYFEQLGKLQGADTAHYIHELDAQANRGHGIDYKPGPEWMVRHTRDPRPKAITWTVQKLHNSLALRNNWLALDEAPSTLPAKLDASIEGNTITLRADTGLKIRVFLDDTLVNLNQPVKMILNDKEVFNGKAIRNLATMVKTLESRGDPRLVYTAEVTW
ncbi:MAG: prolyl oligopeptidase family serine peptidase [Luteolibacter sp.]